MATSTFPVLPSPHTRVGVGGVLLRNGRALVNRAVYRSRFTIPSGYVDPGESLEAAVVREFAEETGVLVTVGRLLLVRHKVIREDDSDVYFAFAIDHADGEPVARPPEIAELKEVPLAEAVRAPWISELSRMVISLAAGINPGWPKSPWKGGEAPGLVSEAFYPPPEGPGGVGTRDPSPGTKRG